MTTNDQSGERHRFSGPHGSAITHVSIDEALSNNWLEIWYQPKIDLRRKCLAGAEALLRMHHPQAGLLWTEDCTGALDDESLVKLTEYSLVTAMRQWVVLRRRASGCSFPSMCRPTYCRIFRSTRSSPRIVRNRKSGLG